MKKHILFILLLIGCKHENYNEVYNHIGKEYTVCGTVTDVFYSKHHVFLNFGGKYPNQEFTAFVPHAAEENIFSYSLKNLEGERICVSGFVKLYKGKPEIIVQDVNQIKR